MTLRHPPTLAAAATHGHATGRGRRRRPDRIPRTSTRRWSWWPAPARARPPRWWGASSSWSTQGTAAARGGGHHLHRGGGGRAAIAACATALTAAGRDRAPTATAASPPRSRRSTRRPSARCTPSPSACWSSTASASACRRGSRCSTTWPTWRSSRTAGPASPTPCSTTRRPSRMLTRAFVLGLQPRDLESVAFELHANWDHLDDAMIAGARPDAPGRRAATSAPVDPAPVLDALGRGLERAAWCTDADDLLLRHIAGCWPRARGRLAAAAATTQAVLQVLRSAAQVLVPERQARTTGAAGSTRSAARCDEAEAARARGARRGAGVGGGRAARPSRPLHLGRGRASAGARDASRFHDLLGPGPPTPARRRRRLPPRCARRYRRILDRRVPGLRPHPGRAGRPPGGRPWPAETDLAARPAGRPVRGGRPQAGHLPVPARRHRDVRRTWSTRSASAVDAAHQLPVGARDPRLRQRRVRRAARRRGTGPGRARRPRGPARRRCPPKPWPTAGDGRRRRAPRPGQLALRHGPARTTAGGRPGRAPTGDRARRAPAGPAPGRRPRRTARGARRRGPAAPRRTTRPRRCARSWSRGGASSTVASPSSDGARRRPSAPVAGHRRAHPDARLAAAAVGGLRRARRPLPARGQRLLWGSDEVRDVLAVLRAADDPTDAVAVVGALRTAGTGLRRRRPRGLAPGRRTLGPAAAAPVGLERPPRGPGHGRARRRCTGRGGGPSPRPWWPAALEATHAFALALAHRRPRDRWHRLRWLLDQARRFDETTGGHAARLPALGRHPGGGRRARRWDRAAGPRRRRRPGHDHPRGQGPRVPGGPASPASNATAWAGTRRPGGVGRRATATLEVSFGHDIATPGYADALAREKELDAMEQVRLLYVAMTRARDHLLLCAAPRQHQERPVRAEPRRPARRAGLGRSRAAGGRIGARRRARPPAPADASPPDPVRRRRRLGDESPGWASAATATGPAPAPTGGHRHAIAERSALGRAGARASGARRDRGRRRAPDPGGPTPPTRRGARATKPLLVGRAVHARAGRHRPRSSGTDDGRARRRRGRPPCGPAPMGVEARADDVAAMVERALRAPTVRGGRRGCAITRSSTWPRPSAPTASSRDSSTCWSRRTTGSWSSTTRPTAPAPAPARGASPAIASRSPPTPTPSRRSPADRSTRCVLVFVAGDSRSSGGTSSPAHDLVGGAAASGRRAPNGRRSAGAAIPYGWRPRPDGGDERRTTWPT